VRDGAGAFAVHPVMQNQEACFFARGVGRLLGVQRSLIPKRLERNRRGETRDKTHVEAPRNYIGQAAKLLGTKHFTVARAGKNVITRSAA
jgi:hypothetical protein